MSWTGYPVPDSQINQLSHSHIISHLLTCLTDITALKKLASVRNCIISSQDYENYNGQGLVFPSLSFTKYTITKTKK